MIGFTMFMLTTGLHAFDRRQMRVVDDMDQPLAHYWINSGHNSYLLVRSDCCVSLM